MSFHSLVAFFTGHSKQLIVAVLVFSLIWLCLPTDASLAQSKILDNLGSTGKGMGSAGDDGAPIKDLPTTIGSIIRVILTLLGVILLVYFVYGGVLWMTAGGDIEQVKKAKAILEQAIIGVAIVLASYAISEFVISRLVSATLDAGTTAPTP